MLTRRHMIGALGAVPAALSYPTKAAERETIDAKVNYALGKMFAKFPNTRELSSKAKALLVMPDVVKGGFIVGGAYGEGALLINDEVQGYEAPAVGYYSVAAASVGLQAGLQTSSHVLFFMTQEGLDRFRRADGWEVGADAEITFPDAGLNAQVNTTLLEKPIIAYVFGQDGLLIGASLEGAKYSPIVR